MTIRERVLQDRHSSASPSERLQVPRQWVETGVTRQDDALGAWLICQYLSEIERDVEIQCIRPLTRDLDPLQPRPERLSLYDEGLWQLFLRDAVEDHHACVGGHGGQIDRLNVL